MSNDTLTVTEVVNSVTVTPVNNTVTVSEVGTQGPAGPTGATGAKGDQGIQGIQGIQGVKGDTGATGAKGDTGAQGSSGVVTVNAPLTNAGTSSAANLSVSTGTTSAVGVLQLTDSVSSTSTTTAATPNAVKTAYDYADTKTLSLAIPSTYYITTPHSSYANITATLSRTNYVSIYVNKTTSFDRIAVTTASTFVGTAVVRLGIYANDKVTGQPSTLILDAGTVSPTASNTVYQITISQSLDAGFYWLAINTQTAASTNNFIGNTASQGVYNVYMPYKPSPTSSFATGWREESITGAFTTAGTLLQLGSTPTAFLRAA